MNDIEPTFCVQPWLGKVITLKDILAGLKSE